MQIHAKMMVFHTVMVQNQVIITRIWNWVINIGNNRVLVPGSGYKSL